eukprot:TRINITY_DN1687_c0_g1_i5.p1 TRINITY_DN1687_c0_g1~~TRINITY_DN1687_c0_g1_i5.p1  ORF type:complete len:174 (+),score=44.82 TRINITY_DN1687_c0_g1_i5:3-524(+)
MAANPSDSSWKTLSTTYAGRAFNFCVVDAESCEGLWSFYPEGCPDPLILEAADPMPTASEVYERLQSMVTGLQESTGLPLTLADAPENEEDIIGIMNKLHEYLPHAIKRIAMKKIGLRQFEQSSPQLPKEWTELMADLEEMGFTSQEENLSAVQAANGNLKQAVKILVRASRP